MPVLGNQVFKLNDDMNIDEDDDDEKQPLALVKQRYAQSNGSSPSKSSPPEPSRKTPRAVVARPPTSHGSKKKKTSSPPKPAERKSVPLLLIDDSSSSDDEIVLSKIAASPKLLTTPKKHHGASTSMGKTAKSKTPNTKPRSTSKSSSPPKNPFSSPNTMKQKRFQIFCNKLERLWDARSKQTSQNGTQKAKKEFNSYAHVVVTSLSRPEIERIPNAEIRADILKRYETHMDRKKMASMTEVEKALYMKQKAAAQKQQQKEKEMDEKKRYDDTTIDAEPLPDPKSVGFDDCNYGDVLMVINFIRSYSALLTPKESVRLTPEELANALVDTENGYPYLAKILLILLHTLIHDEEAALRKEMGVRLTDLELNSSTVGELVRLCLRKHDDEDVDEDGSKTSFESTMVDSVDDEILEEISGRDFADLSPSTKLKLLVALCHRLLSSVAVENYLDDVQQQFADALTERNAAAHEYNKLTKETKQEQESKPPTPAQAPAPAEDPAADSDEDIASKVKRRRLMAEERARREAEERLVEGKRKEKELAEYKVRSRSEAAARKWEDLAALKKAVFRMEPIGTDRNHSRYWYFGKWLPVVFVEKGWTAVDGPEEDPTFGREPFVETTFPKSEENDWRMYETPEDLEALIKTLCIRGIRESKLKERLEACILEIKAAKEKESKNPTTSTAVAIKDYAPLQEDFAAKLVQLESSVRLGGLGGVPDFAEWKAALDQCTTMAEMAEKLIEVSTYIRPTLLCGVLAPDTKKSDPEGETKASKTMIQWCEAVRQCQTWSRLHVLMSMLRSCVRWDRSVEHAKCRICRKKQDDDLALVCDGCNDIYHTYCLRPPLKKLPDGEWFCFSCKPRAPPSSAKKSRRSVYVEVDEDEEDEDDQQGQEDGNEERNENCIVCGEGEFEDQSDELIVCTECSTSFHLNCHTPPLRHRPRNAWRCNQCVSGRQVRSRLREKLDSTRSTRLREKLERDYNKLGHNDVNASANLYADSDLFDDEGSSAEESGSVSSEKRGKRY